MVTLGNFVDDFDAIKRERPHMSNSDIRELILLRTKLEIRTWFLRASLAVNAGVVAGIIVKLFS